MTATGNVPLAPARLSFRMKSCVSRAIAAAGITRWPDRTVLFAPAFCTLCLSIGICLLASPASANPAVQATRLIGYQQVDLSPLFYWWEHGKGVRPLQAWKHVQGVMERQSVYG